MNEEFTDEPAATIRDLTEKGRETLAAAQNQAEGILQSSTDYIRANPWIAIAGAALVGGVIGAACCPKRSPRHENLEMVRGWIEDAYDKLPSQKQVQSVADSYGLSGLVRKIGKALRLN